MQPYVRRSPPSSLSLRRSPRRGSAYPFASDRAYRSIRGPRHESPFFRIPPPATHSPFELFSLVGFKMSRVARFVRDRGPRDFFLFLFLFRVSFLPLVIARGVLSSADRFSVGMRAKLNLPPFLFFLFFPGRGANKTDRFAAVFIDDLYFHTSQWFVALSPPLFFRAGRKMQAEQVPRHDDSPSKDQAWPGGFLLSWLAGRACRRSVTTSTTRGISFFSLPSSLSIILTIPALGAAPVDTVTGKSCACPPFLIAPKGYVVFGGGMPKGRWPPSPLLSLFSP